MPTRQSIEVYRNNEKNSHKKGNYKLKSVVVNKEASKFILANYQLCLNFCIGWLKGDKESACDLLEDALESILSRENQGEGFSAGYGTTLEQFVFGCFKLFAKNPKYNKNVFDKTSNTVCLCSMGSDAETATTTQVTYEEQFSYCEIDVVTIDFLLEDERIKNIVLGLNKLRSLVLDADGYSALRKATQFIREFPPEKRELIQNLIQLRFYDNARFIRLISQSRVIG